MRQTVFIGEHRLHPAIAIRSNQFNDAVEALCRNLSDTDRRLLELSLQGYSTGEIARAVGLSDVALRVRLSRLRQRLRDGGVLADWF